MPKKSSKSAATYNRTDLELVMAAVNGIIGLKDKLPPVVVQSAYRQRRVLVWCLKHSCGPETPNGAP